MCILYHNLRGQLAPEFGPPPQPLYELKIFNAHRFKKNTFLNLCDYDFRILFLRGQHLPE